MCSLHRGGSVALLSVMEAMSFSRQRRECFLYTEERVSRCRVERRQTPSLYREGTVFFLWVVRAVSFFLVPLGYYSLTVLFTYSFSIQWREWLLYPEEGVSLCDLLKRQTPSLCRRESVSSLHKGESVPLLYIEERVSLFYKGRRETPSRCKGECVSLPGREDVILLLSA